MEKGVQAAIRRFPLKGQEIRRMALANSTFRSLCEDLADAEAATERWGAALNEHSSQRQSEYRILMDEPATEIEAMLGSRPSEAGNLSATYSP
jgi:hypothetical protein